MATVDFGNVSADMRFADTGYGIPALQTFDVFVSNFVAASEQVLVNTPTQVVIRDFDASGNPLTATLRGNFTLGLINFVSIEATGVIASFQGNFSALSGVISGTATEIRANFVQGGNLIARISGLSTPLYFSVDGVPHYASDDVLLAGADFITAGIGNDYLLGYAGNDQLLGGDGNDTLDGGGGSDTLSGGFGNDTYMLDSVSDVVNEIAGQGTDTVIAAFSYALAASLENLTLTGVGVINGTGNGADNVLIGNGATNTLSGVDGNDLLDGSGGNDQLDGGNGNDIYVVDSLLDVITDSAGTDAVVSYIDYTLNLAAIENLTLIGGAVNGIGNAGGNLIIGNTTNNSLMGLDGNDTIYGGAGNDSIQGDQNFTVLSGNDVILSEGGDDVVFAGPGDDVVALGAGFDVAIGEGGNDAINGEGGNDAIDGGGGDDTLLGWDDQDILFGASGADILYGGNGNDIMMGNRGDPLDGVDGVDLMFGEAGQDTIHGGAGDDGIMGGDGNDVIDGGLGNDNIIGGLGADIMLGSGINAFNNIQFPSGTAGSDNFIYNNVSEAGDSIYGFDLRAGNEDKLFLQPMIGTFTGVIVNTLAGLQASGHLRLLDTGADIEIQVDANGGGDGYLNLVTLVGVANVSDLTAANFVL